MLSSFDLVVGSDRFLRISGFLLFKDGEGGNIFVPRASTADAAKIGVKKKLNKGSDTSLST